MAIITLEAFSQVFWPYRSATTQRGFSCITDEETNVLLTLVGSFKPVRFVEIGTFKGGTAKRILSDSPSIKDYVAVDCSDPKRDVPLPIEEIGMNAKDDPRYRLIISAEGTKNPQVEDLEADMVFIDANHSYEWCLHDSLLAHRIVKEGGVVVWHDFDYCDGVTRAIMFLNNQGEDSVVWVQGTHVCFEIIHNKKRPGFLMGDEAKKREGENIEVKKSCPDDVVSPDKVVVLRDDEMPAANVGKTNGVVYLIRDSPEDIENFIKSLELLRQNYLQQYPCIVVGFHEASLKDDVRKKINKQSGVDVQYNEVDFSQVPESYNSHLGLNFSLGYRHMCHFFANDVFNNPVVKDWGYYIRLDTDSFILSPVSYNIFERSKKNGVLYGYIGMATENSSVVVEGLRATVARYLDKQSQWKPFRMLGDIPELQMYYNNFEVCWVPWFQHDPWCGFFNEIEKDGGIYRHRWGDHIIRTYGVNLFMNPKNICQYDGIHYRHDVFERNGLQGGT